jgi:hypothetical protein
MIKSVLISTAIILIIAVSCSQKQEVHSHIKTIDAQTKALQDTFYSTTGAVQTNRNFVKRCLKELRLNTQIHKHFQEKQGKSFVEYVHYFEKQQKQADSIYTAHLDYVRNFDAFFSDFEDLRNQVADGKVDYEQTKQELNRLQKEMQNAFQLSLHYKKLGDSLFRQNRAYYVAYEKALDNAYQETQAIQLK